MGCDIHGTIEKLIDDKWVMIAEFPDEARVRNYLRFAALAGVRGDGPEPRGIPTDVSPGTLYNIQEWEGDGHSHSWLPLKDATRIFNMTSPSPDKECEQYTVERFFGLCPFDIGEYRIVFWFDN